MILAVQWYHTLLAFLFVIMAVLLMLVILLQRGKGVGLAGAFGGAATTAAFGSKTGDVLTWITVVGAGILLLYTIILTFVFGPLGPGLGTTGPTDPAAPLVLPTNGEEATPIEVTPLMRPPTPPAAEPVVEEPTAESADNVELPVETPAPTPAPEATPAVAPTTDAPPATEPPPAE